MGKFPWNKTPDWSLTTAETLGVDQQQRALMERAVEQARRQQMEEMYRQMAGVYGSGGAGSYGQTTVAPQKAPDPMWVMVEVLMTDGTTEGINYDATTVSVQKVIEESAKTDMLCLRNVQEWLIVPVAQIKTIKIKKLSTGE